MLDFSIVFPGQGSQSVGMLKTLQDAYPIIKETFDSASKVVGFDCWELAQKGPEQTLNQTAYTQPILLAADIALWELLKAQLPNIQPAMMAGHSLGEYAALVAAGAIRFEDAIYVVHKRGQLMQEAVPPSEGMGSMAAILGLENSAIESICEAVTKESHLVSAANYNAIGQTVIAGNPAAVLEATEKMKQQGAKRAIVLPVSVPSHCALMQGAAEKLAKVLDSIDIQSPKYPILHNRDVQTHQTPTEIKRILCEQLVYPVRWVETIQKMSQQSVDNIIECGPGKVLAGLIKRIDAQVKVYNTDTPETLSEILCLQATV